MAVTGVGMETPVLVALVTVIGGIVGGIVTKALMGKKDSAALAMEIAQQARDDVRELRQEIAELRADLDRERGGHEATRKKRRVLEEKYSAALEWIVVVQTAWEGLKIRLANINFEHREIPPLPMIVAVDLEAGDTTD